MADSSAGVCIAMVAGEPSGDLLGAHLLRALRARLPQARFVGIGGPEMRSTGLESWFLQETLAVRGYVEVIRHLPQLFRLRRQLIAKLISIRPQLFIGIDAPDFNLGVARKLKASGVRTLHYVSPSIWAWRRGRIRLIRRAIDHMLTVFPFEASIYREADVAVTYVGHPLADAAPLNLDRAAERERFKLLPVQPVFAWLPGSRMSELEWHSELFVNTALRIHAELPRAHFLIPLVNRATREYFESVLYRLNAQSLPHTLLYGHAERALASADVGLIASGTATLEAALYGCPHIVTYRLSRATYWLVRRRVRIPYAALPNILFGRFAVAELLQDEATPENLAQALLNLYADRHVCARLRELFSQLHRGLRCGSAERAAQVVMNELHSSPEFVHRRNPAISEI